MKQKSQHVGFEDWIVLNFGGVARTTTINPVIEISHIRHLFAEPIPALTAYTDERINQSLWELVPHMYDLFNDRVPTDSRIQVIQEIYTLFEQLFFPRCTNSLSAFQDRSHIEKLNPLNSICYMWWDIIPLYGKSGDATREALDPYCLQTMERTLELKSLACQEAALHGLGHWRNAYPETVEKIIDDFLARNPKIDEQLRAYAQVARSGGVY